MPGVPLHTNIGGNAEFAKRNANTARLSQYCTAVRRGQRIGRSLLVNELTQEVLANPADSSGQDLGRSRQGLGGSVDGNC
jgi:hypothetical protein